MTCKLVYDTRSQAGPIQAASLLLWSLVSQAATRICFVSSLYSIPLAGAAFPSKTVPRPHPTAALTISTTNVQETRERRVAGLAGSHTS